MFRFSKTTLTMLTLSGISVLIPPSAVLGNLKPTSLFSLQQIQSYNPKISSQDLRQAVEIYAIMKPYLLDFDIDACMVGLEYKKSEVSQENVQKLILKLATLIQAQQPLEFNILTFPFKSGNKDHNVLGHLADMAERKSLEYLHSFINNIKKIYKNSTLTIYTDGLLFSDLFEIADQTVLDYEESLQRLSADLPEIKIISFLNLLNKRRLKVQEVRREIDAPVNLNINLPTENQPAKRTLLKKRIFNEINHSNHSFSSLSHDAQEEALDRLSHLVLKRVQWVGNFVKQFQGENGFHLSVHYQKDLGHKIGLKLFDGSVVTPFNGVMVLEKEGVYSIKYKGQIEPKKYQLITPLINGIPCPYYKWR